MSEVAVKNHMDLAPTFKEQQKIIIGAKAKLTLTDTHRLLRKRLPVVLSNESQSVMLRSHNFLKSAIEQRRPVYGINTNFGDQVNLLDPYLTSNKQSSNYLASIQERQKNVLRGHACGLGEIISPEIVQVTMMLRAHCLAQGYSGVTPASVDAILFFLNKGIIPLVRRYGSIGASGDLIPLSMIGAAIAGENVDVLYHGQMMKAPLAIKKAGLEKLKPEYRDGLGLINGTSFMTAIASIALYQLNRLFFQMMATIAMSLESMLVIDSAYHPLVHQLKHHEGEKKINQFLLNFWQGSHLIMNLEEVRTAQTKSSTSRKSKSPLKPIQDYYSLRSVAQGFGPFYENLEHATTWVENEMNSVNDNPIIDANDGMIHHSANFMGYYITDSCDILKMNISQASTWLHALLANMLHPRKNFGLPTNLVEKSHSSGFRPLQLLAASLAVQNRKLAQNQQAFMLPTEGDNQDVNSLGTHAAFDFIQSVANLEKLTAILLIASVQALEFRGLKKASYRAQAISHIVRQSFSKLETCRPLTEELIAVIDLLMLEKF